MDADVPQPVDVGFAHPESENILTSLSASAEGK